MRGATILKESDDKTRPLNKHNLMAYSGEAGDTGKTAGADLPSPRRALMGSSQSNSPNTSKPTSSSTPCATAPT